MQRCALGLVLLLTLGCASVHVYKTEAAGKYTAVPPDSVRVFVSPDSVPSDYTKVAELEGEGTVFNSQEGIYEKFREEAAKLGANGVILQGFSSQGAFNIEAGPTKSARATAIHIHADSTEAN